MSEITFTRLKKNCKKDMTGKKVYRLAILGDCATQHLATAIRGYGVEEDLDLQVFDADYNQIDAQLIDGESEFYQFDSQFAVIYMCVEKLYHAFSETPDKTAFSDVIYKKIRNYGIRVNSVAPGMTETRMVETDGARVQKEMLENGKGAMSRLAAPKEIADAVYFLASDAASFVNGQTLRVDGGNRL